VADDVVVCDWRPPGHVFGQPAELLRHHIEIRGLGVLDIRALFGITAIRDRKRLDLVVQLCEWTEHDEFDRLGIEERHHTILGTPLREHRVPVRPGRDMSSIIEMAARNELLRRDGRHTAREFLQKLEGHLLDQTALDQDRLDSPAPGEAESLQKPSWSTLMPQAIRTESSAWIPAVKPPKDGEG
jgi:HPr kinase/phosphorylase